MQPYLVSYLFAFLFWWSLALGSLAWLMIHRLVGGRWGNLLYPVLAAASRTLPWLLLLFLPIALGMAELFPWAQPHPPSGLLGHRGPYSNPLAFSVRGVAFFLLWGVLAWRMTPSERLPSRGLSALGLILYALSVTFAGIDWIMSLETHWYSAVFGLLLGAGQLLSALAFGIVVFAFLARRRPSHEVPDMAGRFDDLGNLLLVMVLTWAYLAFMQYLIVWMGNLPDDNTWFVRRTTGGWSGLAVFLVGGQFMAPFGLLLWRRAKRRAAWLGAIALGLLLAHLAEIYWLVLPAFQPAGPRPYWGDPVMLLLIGGFWLATFTYDLRRRWSVPRG